MCSLQYASRPYCDLDQYLPDELPLEETLLYQSSEELIRSFNTNISISSHRVESDSFDPMYDDTEALAALVGDDLFSTNSMSSNSDDMSDYFHERSKVIPHMPVLSTEVQLCGNFPLSPLNENQRSNISSPSSPIYSNRVHSRRFHVFDQTTGRERRPYLHEFIRLLLENDEYSHIIQYIDKKQGIFKLHKPNEIAELWRHAKGRNSDTSKLIFIIQILIINMFFFNRNDV